MNAQQTIVIAGYGKDDGLMAGALLCLKEQMAGRMPSLSLCARDDLAGELALLLEPGALPARLMLVGIGLSVNGSENARLLCELAGKGCEISWYSVICLRDWMRKLLAGSVQLVEEASSTLPQLVFANAGPWRSKAQTAAALRDYKNSNDLLRFCRAAGFVSRVMPAERGREMMSLFLDVVRAGQVSRIGGRLGVYLSVAEQASMRELKGESPAMERVKLLAERAAAVDGLRVMILGESGTGKESVANYLHLHSERWDKPFLAVNCASTNPNLQEAAFQGYRKGTFTGGNVDRKGYFEQVDGGTLFLDEVGDLSLEAQALLLRILEEKRVLPLGAHEEVPVDVRLIAATNKDLWGKVDEGSFREDLLYRLQEFTIRTAALREVPEDIPHIANTMWWRIHGTRLPDEAEAPLMAYDWPGNARELNNVLKFAHAMGGDDWEHLLEQYHDMNGRRARRAKKESLMQYPEALDEMIALHCRRIFEACGCNVSHAAERLGIERSTLRRHLKKTEPADEPRKTP